MIRIILVDDHLLFREALRGLLERRADAEVVAEAADGREAIDAALRLRPDVVLMDIWMPHLSGIEATAELLSRDPKAKVVMLSMHESRSFVEQSLRAGAIGYVVKSAPATELLTAIRHARQGRSYLSPGILRETIELLRAEPDRSALRIALTRREREVLQGIAEGRGSKQIALDLRVSCRTVDSHRSHLMRKLGVHKASDLVRIAIREGLVAP